jgi:hypothetical protein
MLTAFTSNAVQPCILLDLALTTGVQHVWSGVGSLTVGTVTPASFIQSNSYSNPTAIGEAPTSLAFTSPVTAGSLLVCYYTDNEGYFSMSTANGVPMHGGADDDIVNLNYVLNAPAGDTTIGNFNPQAAGFPDYCIAEFAGVDTVDNITTSMWTTDNTEPASITVAEPCLVISSIFAAGIGDDANQVGTIPDGWTTIFYTPDSENLDPTHPRTTGLFYRWFDSPGTYTFAWPWNAGAGDTEGTTFMAAFCSASAKPYQGIGSLGSIGDISEGTEVKAEGATITLSGIDPALLNDCLNDIKLGAPVTLWLGLFSDGAVIATYPLYVGTVDRPTIPIGPDMISITLALENRMANLQRPSNRRYTASDQMYYFPTDSGFSWVETLNDIALVWGS